MTIINKIDWDSVEMSPMTGSGYEPVQSGVTFNGQKNTVKKTVFIGGKAILLVTSLILFFGGISLIIFGVKTYQGQVEPPEFTYEQVMGLLVVFLGIFVMRFKIKR